MKKSIILLLIAVMVFSISGCSLFSETAATKTQPENTSADTKTNSEPEDTVIADNTLTPGTQDDQGKKVKVTLYFATEDNGAVKEEQREVTVKDGAILRASVEALLAGPQTTGLHKTIPEGTTLIGINLKSKVAIVDFSKEYSTANGRAEIAARASIINTLTGIPGVEVEKVRIHVEGKELVGMSGKPLGDMGRVALDLNGIPISGEMKILTLYFGNSNADAVIAEKREVEITKGELLEKRVFLELMNGPVTKGLYAAIPKGTKLLSIKTKDGLCTLDLSSEFVDNHPGGTAGEAMALNSIINSLTELNYIKKVQFLIDGQKRKVYTHAVFDKPFSRNADMIGKQ